MRRVCFALLGVGILLIPAVRVSAAGAMSASISGPGVDRPIELLDRVPNLPAIAGAWFAARAEDVRPLAADAPVSDLGPRYTLTWVMLGPPKSAAGRKIGCAARVPERRRRTIGRNAARSGRMGRSRRVVSSPEGTYGPAGICWRPSWLSIFGAGHHLGVCGRCRSPRSSCAGSTRAHEDVSFLRVVLKCQWSVGATDPSGSRPVSAPIDRYGWPVVSTGRSAARSLSCKRTGPRRSPSAGTRL